MKKEIEEIVKELCSPNGEFPTKIIELNGYEYFRVAIFNTIFKFFRCPPTIHWNSNCSNTSYCYKAKNPFWVISGCYGNSISFFYPKVIN